MSGEALAMKLKLAQLMRRHQVAPMPCAPTAPLSSVDIDGAWMVEGYAAPATIDNEHTKFAPYCWMPFKQNIPLLYRHHRPAGEVKEVRRTDKGLYVSALVTDSEAKRCSHFSVAATIHGFMLRDVEDRERFHALVTCATLDEISLTNAPASPAATVLHRYRQPAAVEMYDLATRAVSCMREIVTALRVINAAQPNAAPAPKPRPTPRHAPAHIMSKPPSQFSQLARELSRRHA